MQRGIQIGDSVRLYGYPGTFVVEAETCGPYEFIVAKGRLSFGALSASVVEINGQPVPMLSCPIAPPASDYPHEPRFDYVDGPAASGERVIDAWHYARAADAFGDDMVSR